MSQPIRDNLSKAMSTTQPKSKNDNAFENYFFELFDRHTNDISTTKKTLADKQAKTTLLVEQYVQSILNRLKIPHLHENHIVTDHFFKHITDHAKALAKQSNADIDVDIYISGDTIKSLLAHMYKFVYERQHAKPQTEKTLKALGTTNKNVQDLPDDIKKQMALKQKALGTEFHLKQSNLAEKEPVPSPLVFGVNNALDIYYEIKPTNSSQTQNTLTPAQIAAGKKIKQEMEAYIEKIKTKINPLALDAFANVMLPKPDVKEYHKHLSNTLEQGGSLLDTLAFKLNNSDSEQTFQFKHPKGHPNILNDFLDGTYEYIPPTPNNKNQAQNPKKVSQEKIIESLKPLTEMPFLDISNPSSILKPLKEIRNELQDDKGNLTPEAIHQFGQLSQNAHFQGGKNRAYSEGKQNIETPLSVALEIAETAYSKNRWGDGNKIRFLLPDFAQKMTIKKTNPAKMNGEYYFLISPNFKPYQDFIDQNTDNGELYHGTAIGSGISMLRGGFVLSTDKQGTAACGPGVYFTNHHDTAKAYAGSDGMILPLPVVPDNNMKILDWNTLPYQVQCNLRNEAHEKKYDDVFDMLRSRNEYAVDVIINHHILIQNQAVLDCDVSLKTIFEATQPDILQLSKQLLNINQDSYVAKWQIDSFFMKIISYIRNQHILHTMGDHPESVDDALKTLHQKAKALKLYDYHLEDDNSYYKALMLATFHDNQNVVEKLLQNHPHHLDWQNLFLQKALQLTTVIPDHKTLIFLLKKCPTHIINAKDGKILKNAIKSENSNLVAFLLNQGADVHAINKKGYSPLIYAARDNDTPEIVELLIQKGADINLQTPKQQKNIMFSVITPGKKTALMMATDHDALPIVQTLLQHQADVNLQDQNGNTALMIACAKISNEKNTKKIVSQLMQHGTNLNIRNKEGKTALMLAQETGKKDIVNLLLDSHFKKAAKKINHTAMMDTMLEDCTVVNMHHD